MILFIFLHYLTPRNPSDPQHPQSEFPQPGCFLFPFFCLVLSGETKTWKKIPPEILEKFFKIPKNSRKFSLILFFLPSITNLKYWGRCEPITSKTLQLLNDLSIGYPFGKGSKIPGKRENHPRFLLEWHLQQIPAFFFSFFPSLEFLGMGKGEGGRGSGNVGFCSRAVGRLLVFQGLQKFQEFQEFHKFQEFQEFQTWSFSPSTWSKKNIPNLWNNPGPIPFSSLALEVIFQEFHKFQKFQEFQTQSFSPRGLPKHLGQTENSQFMEYSGPNPILPAHSQNFFLGIP